MRKNANLLEHGKGFALHEACRKYTYCGGAGSRLSAATYSFLPGQAGWKLSLPRLGVMDFNVDKAVIDLERRASFYRKHGQFALAEKIYLDLLSLQEKDLGPDHRRLASTLFSLSELSSEQLKLPEAAEFYQRALEIMKRFDDQRVEPEAMEAIQPLISPKREAG